MNSLVPKIRKRAAKHRRRLLTLAMAGVTLLSPGCGMLNKLTDQPQPASKAPSYHDHHGMKIEYPDVAKIQSRESMAAAATDAPHALRDPSELPSIEMSLEKAIHTAVKQSPVIRSLNASVVAAPLASATAFDPALTSASPFSGTEAALAAFDAQYAQQLFWQKTDQPQNVDQGGFTAAFTPAVRTGTGASFIGDLSKRTAQGAQFALRHVVNYNYNNQPFRAFQSDFVGWLEAEWRQPMMRGAGTEFNRIAGPNSPIGQYNGVLIARVTEDVALADFEQAIIQLVSDVEQAYWDLVTAYRILEANVKGRESALQTFQYQQIRLEVGTGRQDEEAQARSQFYQFQAQVESSLGGNAGLYAAEQRLRYLIGMQATDGHLIRPTTSPADMKVVFDWNSALGQALERRVEVRRQKYQVKRREMELVAANLNRRPQLDFLGQYRWRGLGDNLIGNDSATPLDNLYDEILGGDYQEWQAGLEMSFPVGLRAASVAVAHAKLNLKRERALLNETELRISHDLSNVTRQLELTHKLLETNYNRYVSDLRQVEVLRRRYRDGSDNINFLLQAQRQVVLSEAEFYRSLANYNVAIRDLHLQKGSLLAYNHVFLQEAPWNHGAQYDAFQVGQHLKPRQDPASVSVPRPVSQGAFDPTAPQATSLGGQTLPAMNVPVPGSPATEAQPLSDEGGGDDEIPPAPGGDTGTDDLTPPERELDVESLPKPNGDAGELPEPTTDAPVSPVAEPTGMRLPPSA